MIYPSLLVLKSKEDYQAEWELHYCRGPIHTFDGIAVRFRKNDFDHAFYETVKREKDLFSQKRAERLHWIKTTLQDPMSDRFIGWDSKKRQYDLARRVAIVVDNYVVVIAILSEKINEARFITAYVGDAASKKGRSSTIDLIRSGPRWESTEIKKPLICQAGSAEAFIGSTTTGGELPSI